MTAKARQRAELILQVRSGQLSATAAAQTLGISRQQYYQWEQRALSALLSAVEEISRRDGPKRQRTRRRNNSNAGCKNWSNRCNARNGRNRCVNS